VTKIGDIVKQFEMKLGKEILGKEDPDSFNKYIEHLFKSGNIGPKFHDHGDL